MSTWIDALTPAHMPVTDPQLDKLKELAVDIGSNVAIVDRKYRVDGLEFDTLDAAIAHCREVA